jgi:hypothetical protein
MDPCSFVARPLKLFYSYAREDEELRDGLDKHLSALKRSGIISEWHDRQIVPGEDWRGEIDTHLESADIILLLISSDFLSSNYCYEIEMKRALQRQDDGAAVVIPVLLRPCDCTSMPFEKLNWLPRDGFAVAESKVRPTFPSIDSALFDVANGIRTAAQHLLKRRIAESGRPHSSSGLREQAFTC